MHETHVNKGSYTSIRYRYLQPGNIYHRHTDTQTHRQTDRQIDRQLRDTTNYARATLIDFSDLHIPFETLTCTDEKCQLSCHKADPDVMHNNSVREEA